MPVISTRRYSTTTGSSSYLPPPVGGTTSSLSNLGKTTTSSGLSSSSYRNNSLSNSYSTSGYTSSGIGSGISSSYLSRAPSYRSGLYSSSTSLGSNTRTSSYLTGGNNDTTATASSRFGVSNYRYSRSSSDRDTITSTRGLTGKTQYNSNNINNNNSNSYNNINTTSTTTATGTKSTTSSKTVQTKPPIGSLSKRQQQRSESRSRDNSTTRPLSISDNINKIGVTSKSDANSNYNINNNCISSKLTSSSSSYGTAGQGNSKPISSSLSSSSLALQVATSGLDLYEKYSPTHYIPKCELSRSRSLSEATPNNYCNDNNLNNSSSNIHQLLQQRENKQQHSQQNQKLQDDIDCINKTVSSSQSSSSLSASKDSNSAQTVNKVRNTSIRSALPSSPTPSRYWDREGRSSILSGRNLSDIDDYTSTKSALNSSDSYDKISTETREGLCGLRNIGNTCFMNSVIQCLSHTRELTKFLRNQVGIKSSSKDQQILYEFAKLIREMWAPNARSVTPHELKSAFSSKHRMYSGYNQQDAQEFLRFFLDSLHCALNTGVKGEPLKIDESLSDNKKADLTWENYSKVENSVIKDLFVGQLKSTLKCTSCGNTSVTFDPFWDLSVPLPSSSRCKLDACLDFFIREEILDGDEMPTCSKCQARRKCTKSFTIQRFPKYLVIHLKRFSETRWSKLSNIVEFPTGEKELNMGPYASNNTSSLYTLYAVSNHMGSTAGGHYVALCRHPVTKKWHEFNDNVVSDDISESVLVSSSAYLLFYERAY